MGQHLLLVNREVKYFIPHFTAFNYYNNTIIMPIWFPLWRVKM